MNYLNSLIERHRTHGFKAGSSISSVRPRLESRFEVGATQHQIPESNISNDTLDITPVSTPGDDSQVANELESGQYNAGQIPVDVNHPTPREIISNNLDGKDKESVQVGATESEGKPAVARPENQQINQRRTFSGSKTENWPANSALISSGKMPHSASSTKFVPDVDKDLDRLPDRGGYTEPQNPRTVPHESIAESLVEAVSKPANPVSLNTAVSNIDFDFDFSASSDHAGILQSPGQLPDMPVALRPSAADQQPPSTREPEVNITIGRIEIRASGAAPSKSPAPGRKLSGVMTLDDYLGRRNRERA